jgi:hypothetical protein
MLPAGIETETPGRAVRQDGIPAGAAGAPCPQGEIAGWSSVRAAVAIGIARLTPEISTRSLGTTALATEVAVGTVGIAVLATGLMILTPATPAQGTGPPALEHGGVTREHDTVTVSTATVVRASGFTIGVTVDPPLTGGMTRPAPVSSDRGNWYLASGLKDRVAGLRSLTHNRHEAESITTYR